MGSNDDLFEGYRTLDAEIISHAADGAVVDLNGTQVMFKQREHVPVAVEIYIEDEEKPIGAINIARGETVALGGISEGLSDDIADVQWALSGLQEDLDRLEKRMNRPKRREDDDWGDADG